MCRLISQLGGSLIKDKLLKERAAVIEVDEQRFRIDSELEGLFFLGRNLSSFDARAGRGDDFDLRRHLEKSYLRIFRFRIDTLFLPNG